MSWISKGLSFVRVNGRISPVASKPLGVGSVFYCEIPVIGYEVSDDDCIENNKKKMNHGVFALACAQKWSNLKGVSFPCTFNKIASLKHVDLLDTIFKHNQILAKTLATSLKAECPPPYLFTGIQIFERSDTDYNSSIVQLSEGRTFLVAVKDINKGEVITYTDNCEFNEQVSRDIFINTAMNPLRSIFPIGSGKNTIDSEKVIRLALDIFESIEVLPKPSDDELELVMKLIEKFVANNNMGISKFKEEAEILMKSAKLIENEPVDFAKMEKEYQRLVETLD